MNNYLLTSFLGDDVLKSETMVDCNKFSSKLESIKRESIIGAF